MESASAVVALGYPKYLLAQTNCTHTCGNITIPFPFVSFPIVYSNLSCKPTNYGNGTTVTFSGSPFFFSQDNMFVAVGCDNVATMRDSGPSFVGCRNGCTGNNTRRLSTSSSFDCSQLMIPYGTQDLTIEFQGDKNSGTNGGNHDCQFSFLVNSSRLRPNMTDLYALRDGGYVPVVLRWGLVGAAIPRSIGLILDDRYFSGSSAVCRTESNYINKNATPFIQCSCNYGFYGKPYIQDGCREREREDGGRGDEGRSKARGDGGPEPSRHYHHNRDFTCAHLNFNLVGACVRAPDATRLRSVHFPGGRATDAPEKESPLPVYNPKVEGR
ncbi:hypothetical protein CRG98_016019 [Punica granatum]|uniref:Uncharacterized protein n=1 Tax=Punica granatum TaxID=22663 RepID=A0A2I0K4W1_PUNGR|nr:hypothetical protein CRG98_016019 [Punica granatum]